MKREIDLNELEKGQPHWMQPKQARLSSIPRKATRQRLQREFMEKVRNGEAVVKLKGKPRAEPK